MEITPIFPIAGQEFSRYFKVYLKLFSVFQNSDVIIPLFLSTHNIRAICTASTDVKHEGLNKT
jgi:hypothetical protein